MIAFMGDKSLVVSHKQSADELHSITIALVYISGLVMVTVDIVS